MYVLDEGTRVVVPRTELTYPGHNPRMHQNAAQAPVDHVMADFEDACPYEYKGEPSRRTVVEALTTIDFGRKVVTVRPNNIRSKFFLGDLQAIMQGAPDRFHGIIVPKTHSPEEIVYVSKLLDALERENGWKSRVQLEALIETPHALVHAYEIATASDRMVGLIFGIADFAAALGVREMVEDQNKNFHYAKQATVVAAKAAGLHAIDNAFLSLIRPRETSPEEAERLRQALRRKNQEAANLGMDGTWVIHPQQAEIANECYTPSAEQIETARKTVEYYHSVGGGAIIFPETGEFHDEATVKGLLMLLAKAVQAGVLDGDYLARLAAKSREVTGYDILQVMRRTV